MVSHFYLMNFIFLGLNLAIIFGPGKDLVAMEMFFFFFFPAWRHDEKNV